MKKSYFLFVLFSSTILFSQTKLIAYKSHSGNLDHFETSVSKNLFDANDSNLGLPPTILKIDSVIFLENNKAKIISQTKRFSREEGVRRVETIPFKNSGKHIDKVLIDSLIYRNYDFISNKDSIVFLKYNQKKNSYKKVKFSKQKPQIKKSEIKNSGLWNAGLILLVFLISAFAALNSWRKNRNYES